MRRYSSQDNKVMRLDSLLKGILGVLAPREHHAMPGVSEPDVELDARQRQEVIGLMRVNHSGEICAQALYTGQALTAKTPELHATLQEAAREEEDHLFWTAERLKALGGHTSFFNPVWYTGALALGAVAGVLGDRWSLGFLQETEEQVEAHLASHLKQLPEHDKKSRAIVEQMREDEARHAQMASDHGAAKLPLPVRWTMTQAAKVMTTTAYWI